MRSATGGYEVNSAVTWESGLRDGHGRTGFVVVVNVQVNESYLPITRIRERSVLSKEVGERCGAKSQVQFRLLSSQGFPRLVCRIHR